MEVDNEIRWDPFLKVSGFEKERYDTKTTILHKIRVRKLPPFVCDGRVYLSHNPHVDIRK